LAINSNHQLSPDKIKDPLFWIEAWQAANRLSHVARRRCDINVISFWNKMAGMLEHISGQERMRQRIELTLKFLEEKKISLSGMKVLDIGAGIGDFSLAFASCGAQVTALEPAPALLKVLQKRMQDQRLDNILLIQKEWEKTDPVEDQLAKSFDLVFASLTPGVRDPSTLETMTASSRKWCLLCDIAGGGSRGRGREELWQIIFAEEMPPTYYSIVYPLNYLCALGYEPNFQTWTETWGESLPLQEAVDNLHDFFSLYIEPTASLRHTIEHYVTKRAINGIYREQYPVRLGMVLWKAS